MSGARSRGKGANFERVMDIAVAVGRFGKMLDEVAP